MNESSARTGARRRAVDRLMAEYLELDDRRGKAFIRRCQERWPRLAKLLQEALESDKTVSVLDPGATELVDEFATKAMTEPMSAPRQAEREASLSADRRLGPWRVIEAVGEGGMGVVYRGERADGAFELDVAIKLLRMKRPGLGELLQRECRFLARLNHPGITRLLDAGLDREGGPFVVMEWVEGQDLDVWLKENPSLDHRLEVFENICDSVAHAHRRLVVHGDIKPANMRIGSNGNVKLMDFGVARLLDEAGGEPEVVAMTPRFAAPEQIAGQEISPLSDVWSLGALLAVMLDRPIPGRSALQSESEAELAPLGNEELAAIVARACAEEADRRYQSADDLIADLRRYRQHEPVQAMPASTTYRMAKFMRRNPVMVGGFAATFLALTVGLVATSIMYLEAEQARSQATFERDRAEEHAAQLEQVATFQEQQLAEIDVQMMGAGLRSDIIVERRQILSDSDLDRAAIQDGLEALESALAGVNFTNIALESLHDTLFVRSLDAIEQQFADQPLVKARLLQAAANTMREVGLLDLAMEPQTTALAIRREALGNQHPQTLGSMQDKGVLLLEHGEHEQAKTLLEDTVAMRRKVLGEDEHETLSAINDLAMVMVELGRYDEAETLYREALEGNRRVLGDDHRDTINSIANLGFLYFNQAEPEKALPYFREARASYGRIFGDDHPDTLRAISSIAASLSVMEKDSEAEDHARQAWEGYREIYGDEHHATLNARENLASSLAGQGRYDEAEHHNRQVLETRRSVIGKSHWRTVASMNNLVSYLRHQGRLEEAEALAAEAVSAARVVFPPTHLRLGIVVAQHGRVLLAMDEFDRAEEALKETHRVFASNLDDSHPYVLQAKKDVARVYEAWAEAAPDSVPRERKRDWLQRLEAIEPD